MPSQSKGVVNSERKVLGILFISYAIDAIKEYLAILACGSATSERIAIDPGISPRESVHRGFVQVEANDALCVRHRELPKMLHEVDVKCSCQ